MTSAELKRQRRAAGLCPWCGAGLPEGWPYRMCPEHHEQQKKLARASYRRDIVAARAAAAARMRKSYQLNPAPRRAATSEEYQARVTLKVCAYCGREDAVPGRRYGVACKGRNRGRGPSRLRRRASTADAASRLPRGTA